MTVMLRLDQADKVSSWILDNMDGAERIHLDRRTGPKGFRQVGDGWDREEIESLGTPEAIIGAVLDRAGGSGSWRLRAYMGQEEDGTVRSQPEVRFETVPTTATRQQAPESTGAAARDLAAQVVRGSDILATRLDGAMERIEAGQGQLLTLLRETHARESATQDQASGVILTQAVALARSELKCEWLEMQLEEARENRGAPGALAIIMDKLPPEAMTAIATAGMQALILLSQRLIAALAPPAGAPAAQISGGAQTAP